MFDSNKPSHSILVAHGADETRHRLKAILKAASHRRIVGVASARETIDRLRRSRFDLLVTAIDLPDIDCWRLLRMIGSGAFCARIPALVLCDYPASQASLARRRPDDEAVAERFEVYVAGVELCNGFGELTDPKEQRARLLRDQRERAARRLPVYPIDERFLAALERGLPPSGGNALGVDRLVALACGTTDIGDVMAFTADEG